MNDSTEYIGNFAAGYADDYDSMMGGMNFSVATDDVHVSTVSTSTMGGSDDVAAHDVHVSTVSTSTLGGSDDVNLHNDKDGDPMTRTYSCASIDLDFDIGDLNWSDLDVQTTNNMAVTTRKRKGSPVDGESGAATPSVSNTRSAKNGRVNDREKGGDKMEEGCSDDVAAGAAAVASPAVDDNNSLNLQNNLEGLGDNVGAESPSVDDNNIEGSPDDDGAKAYAVTSPLMMAASNLEGGLDDDGAGGAAVLVGLMGGNNHVAPSADPLGGNMVGIKSYPSQVTRHTRRARGTRSADLAHKGRANEKSVLFLMPDLGEVESLLKFKLPHKKWLKYYECLLTDVDGEVVRQENGDTLVFGDEMFLVAIEVARAQLSVGEKGKSFDLNDTNSGNYKSYVNCMNSIFQTFTFMNTRHFIDMLTNDTENLHQTLNELKVATIVCSRLPLMGNEVKLMKIMSHADIDVYPPWKCQIRTWDPPKSLSQMNLGEVKCQMSYVVRLNKWNWRTGVKELQILYQTYERDLGGQVETRYAQPYFSEDAIHLSKDIAMIGEHAEFKFDYKVISKREVETGLVVELSFVAETQDAPPFFHGHNYWKLNSVKTWPVFDIPTPNEPVMEGDGGFYSVVQCLGQSVFQYLNYYDKGRLPL